MCRPGLVPRPSGESGSGNETRPAMAEPRGWVQFFSELSTFLVTCGRQYGLANEQYTEYAIERLSLSRQGVQSLIGPISRSRSPALRRIEECLMQLLQDLEHVLRMWMEYSDTLDQHRASSHYVTPTEVTGTRGRPRFQISKQQLEYLRSLSFSWTAIADMLMVSRMTVYRRRVEFGLLVEPHFSITDQELIRMVQYITVQHPQVGQSFISGRLRSLGYRVTRERVRQAIRTCDPLNAALRWQGMSTSRRPYSVPGPNSLWHIGMYNIPIQSAIPLDYSSLHLNSLY